MTPLSELPCSRSAAKRAGNNFYFTGKPCKHGHIAKRYTRYGGCTACEAREKTAATCKDPVKLHERRLASARRNKDKVNARNRSRRDPERERARGKAYYEQNKEQMLAKNRAYAKANPDKRRANSRRSQHRRRVLERGADGFYCEIDLVRIRKAQRDRCGSCRVGLNGGGHVDHIRPLARGGSNWPANIQWLCEPCNLSKGHRDPVDFMRSRGRLL